MRHLAPGGLPLVLVISSLMGACGGGGGGADVTGPPPGPVAVASVTVTPAAASLSVGSSTTLTATVRDAPGNVLNDRVISWTSSTPTVASVSSAGAVTAVGAGTSTVTASSEGRSGSATVTVTPAAVASVLMVPSEATIVVGTTVVLRATPYDASGNPLAGRDVVWTSSDEAVAKGNTSGSEATISGVAPGTATITATIEGRSAVATIVVLPVGGPPNVCQRIAGALVIANDGQYLGRLTNQFDSESIYNEFGSYGSEFSATSIYNQFGTYGSEFSALSPFNQFTNTPPILQKNGAFVAFFTINPIKVPGISPGAAETCGF